jgi:hypothetical protein
LGTLLYLISPIIAPVSKFILLMTNILSKKYGVLTIKFPSQNGIAGVIGGGVAGTAA